MSIKYLNHISGCTEQRRETGSVLVVGIVILMVLTLMAVVAMRVTTLEERMAGGLRDRDLAFQAAEAALREGEGILTLASLPSFDDTDGYFQPDRTLWDRNNSVWSSGSIEFSEDLDGVAEQPRYIIEELPPVPESLGSLAADEPIPDAGVYRVTARGVGGRESSVVMLQTTFKR